MTELIVHIDEKTLKEIEDWRFINQNTQEFVQEACALLISTRATQMRIGDMFYLSDADNMWGAIREACALIERDPNFTKIHGEDRFTVYRTAGTIRIDIHNKEH